MPHDKNKKILWISIALIVLIAVLAIPLLFNQGSDGEENSEDMVKTTPIPTFTPATTPTTATTSTSSDQQTTTASQSQEEGVEFTVYVDESNIQDCGMTCREVPATLKNTGEKTAHNVRVEVRFYCDGDRIDVNGKEYISLDLGTMEPGESQKRTEEIDVGFGGGLCIQNNGARIEFTVISDEKTMIVEQTYTP